MTSNGREQATLERTLGLGTVGDPRRQAHHPAGRADLRRSIRRHHRRPQRDGGSQGRGPRRRPDPSGVWGLRAYGRPTRAGLKPLEITQPDGPSFEIDGHEIRWQKWSFRIGFTPREGLVLYTVGTRMAGACGPSSTGPPSRRWSLPTATRARDSGARTLSTLVSTTSGPWPTRSSSVSTASARSATSTPSWSTAQATPYKIKNAVCLHEEDAGLGWKHYDMRADTAEVRRSRRLVVSFIATVANYEYGFYWNSTRTGRSSSTASSQASSRQVPSSPA